MKKYILILAVLLTTGCRLFAQNSIGAHLGYGYYLGNSENKNPVMFGQKFTSHIFYGVSLQKEDVFGLRLMLDYSYHEIRKNDIMKVIISDIDFPEPVGPSIGGDLTLVSHNFDLAYVRNFSRYLSYGAGPSFVIINRIFELDQAITDGSSSRTLYDKLASSGLGVNGFLMFTMPVAEGSGLFISSRLQLRYTHSIWFDKGMRKLDNYYQEFTTAQVTIGAGYAF